MKRHVAAIVLAVTTTLAGYAGAAAAQCCGDCNGDNQVTVDEIVTAISRALSGCSNDGVCNASVESCNADLFNLQITLDATRATLGNTLESLSICEGDLAGAQANLFTCENDLGNCSEELFDRQARLNLCNGDLAACLSAPRVPASGETTAHGAGSDGDLRPGAALSYTDNADGTITDNSTNLMWEKKDDSGGVHDVHNTYTWSSAEEGTIMDGTISTTFLAALNEGEGFAGYTDWRIPSVKELQSIVDYEGLFMLPSVDATFHQAESCAGCLDVTATACSCTASFSHWSSTSIAAFPTFAWFVNFSGGNVDDVGKTTALRVRAVRGGL